MRLYTSSKPETLWFSARTHQLEEGDCRKLLASCDIDFIVNLWHTRDDRLLGQYHYVHLPMPDGQLRPEVVGVAERAVEETILALARRRHVLVHCWGGRNRSGLVVAMVLARIYGISGVEALSWVRSARPGALGNKHFCQYLEAMQ